MKFTPEVQAALETLYQNAENDFERHRLDVLIRDFTAPPTVEVIDDIHQRFNGIIYRKDKDGGHYFHHNGIHQAVWRYHYGAISNGYDIHHVDENKDNNSIENLKCLPHKEHMKIHKHCLTIKEHTCIICGKKFSSKGKKNYCSHTCWLKSKGTFKICAFCGREFLAYLEDQKYCSIKCNNTARTQAKKETERICKNCGEVFTGRIGEFCSNKCYQRFNYRNNVVEQTCAVCGKTFKAFKYNKVKKTCSHSCAAKLKQQHQKNITPAVTSSDISILHYSD